MKRLLIWRGFDHHFAEAASVDLGSSGLRAAGMQVGSDPIPYQLEYTIDAARDFITRRLSVEVVGSGWSRAVRLVHDGAGRWDCESEYHGEVDLPTPGGDSRALAGALDCDLGFSPLTNLMPIRRHSLQNGPGSVDCLMAWVSVPDLRVIPYPQRYEHLRVDRDAVVVRFSSLGIHDGFTTDLVLDREGLVLIYPDLAQRVEV